MVLDLDLPDMTGLQLIDALARHGGAGGIILTSGHPARLVQAAAYAQSRGISVLATLEKPLKSGRVRAVAATLQGELRMQRDVALVSKPQAVVSRLSRDDLLLALATGRIEGHLQPQHHVDSDACAAPRYWRAGATTTARCWSRPSSCRRSKALA